MPSSYLAPGDYATYGIPNATAQQVVQASVIVDAAIGRPEGVLWTAGSDGSPGWMTGADPSASVALPGAIAAGTNVALANMPAWLCTQDLVGDVIVLERGVSGKAEACIVSAVSGTTVTLAKVVNAHAAGVTAEFGLTITEVRVLPARRNIVPVMRSPLVRVMSAMGRYGYPRRSESLYGVSSDYALISMVQQVGGVPVWNAIDVTQCGVDAQAAQVFLPVGMMLAPWTDAKVRYLAGFPDTQIPAAVKSATAKIVSQLQSTSEISGNIQLYRAGDTEIRRFSDTLLDTDTKASLDPFRIRAFI